MALSYEEKIVNKIRKISLLVLLIGFVLLIISTNADKGLLEPHKYEFEIETQPSEKIVLNDFQIQYDFVNYKGKINFKMLGTNLSKYIEFRIPEGLDIINFNWTGRSNRLDEDYIIYENGTDYILENRLNPSLHRIISIKNINIEKKDYGTEIELYFEGKLYPNAEFRFAPQVSNAKPPRGKENGAFFKFYLGDKYSCTNLPCYETPMKDDIEFHIIENRLTVSTKVDKQGWKDIRYPSILNLNYNKERNDTFIKIKKIAFSIVLLTLMPSVELGLWYYYKNKRKRKK